jgi:signal transduction histidine kinase
MNMTNSPFEDPQAAISARYFDAISRFIEGGQEDSLVLAYELARDALQQDLSLIEAFEMHRCAREKLSAAQGLALPIHADRCEHFFLEILSVYDMAARGYRGNIESLKAENQRCKRLEAKLLDITHELESQRDELDLQVTQRTIELDRKAAALKESNEQLQQTNKEQAEFTYAISHDLKSPINTVGMLITELSEHHCGQMDQEGQALISLATQTIQRMGTLVDDVLGYSCTIEEGFVTDTVDLNLLFATITADLKAEIAENDVVVNLEELPAVVGNTLQLRIFFQNLISNAIKFRTPGVCCEITVTSAQDSQSNTTTISVSDNGIGIAQEFHERIFGLFQRLHTHDSYPGSGLGLTLCRRIASNHQGTINLVSAVADGATFSLELKGTLDE